AFSTHPRAVEMSKSLFSVKELFLVGFFVVIGLQSVPTWSDLLMALTLCAILLPFNFVSFYLMGRLFGLRNRTSVRSSLALSNFSEFALIVVAVGIDNGLFEDDWLTITALAVALGMIISSLANATVCRSWRSWTPFCRMRTRRVCGRRTDRWTPARQRSSCSAWAGSAAVPRTVRRSRRRQRHRHRQRPQRHRIAAPRWVHRARRRRHRP